MRIYSSAVLTLKWVRMCPNCMLFTGCQSYLFFGRFCLLSLLVTWHTPLRGVVGPRLARQALFTWERANLIYTTYLLLMDFKTRHRIMPMTIPCLAKLTTFSVSLTSLNIRATRTKFKNRKLSNVLVCKIMCSDNVSFKIGMIESTMTDLQLQLKHIQATYTNRNTGFISMKLCFGFFEAIFWYF